MVRIIHNSLILILFFMSNKVIAQKGQKSYDVVVYGATPSGVMAAVAASRQGGHVLLIEQTKHVGGMNTSGIGTAETEHMIEETISGLPFRILFKAWKILWPK